MLQDKASALLESDNLRGRGSMRRAFVFGRTV